MARMYDFTREVNNTIITAEITIADFATMTFRTITVKDNVSGTVDAEGAKRFVQKAYPDGKVMSVKVEHISAMLGWNLADIIEQGCDLNPCTRQPWLDGMTEEKKQAVWDLYRATKAGKTDGANG